VLNDYAGERVYFIHSYCAVESPENSQWILTTTTYGLPFISGVQRGNVVAFQVRGRDPTPVTSRCAAD
jgi:imidazole glycerol-phosphate synthase